MESHSGPIVTLLCNKSQNLLLLSNNLINLGLYDDVKKELADAGKELIEIEEVELEPSLGNGGLGRLAACFIDSISSLGLG